MFVNTKTEEKKEVKGNLLLLALTDF